MTLLHSGRAEPISLLPYSWAQWWGTLGQRGDEAAFVVGRVGLPLRPRKVMISFKIKDPDLSTPSHFLFYC